MDMPLKRTTYVPATIIYVNVICVWYSNL